MGGGLVTLGGTPIPIPNVVVQGRSGVAKPLDRPLDVSYGVDLTGLPFGILPLEVGADWLLVDQAGARPAIAVTNNVWFATNAVGLPWKAEPELQAWAADHLEVDASWYIGKQLVYVGVAQYTDVLNPALTLTPAVGVRLDPSPARPGGLQILADARWFGVNRTKDLDAVMWASAPRGIVGATLGLSYMFGSPK